MPCGTDGQCWIATRCKQQLACNSACIACHNVHIGMTQQTEVQHTAGRTFAAAAAGIVMVCGDATAARAVIAVLIPSPAVLCCCSSPPACDRLVEAGALAQLFAVFMGRSKIKNSKGDKTDKDVAKEVEERCVSIISNLFQVGVPGGVRRGFPHTEYCVFTHKVKAVSASPTQSSLCLLKRPLCSARSQPVALCKTSRSCCWR